MMLFSIRDTIAAILPPPPMPMPFSCRHGRLHVTIFATPLFAIDYAALPHATFAALRHTPVSPCQRYASLITLLRAYVFLRFSRRRRFAFFATLLMLTLLLLLPPLIRRCADAARALP